jgi:hypothetical protein
MVDAQRAELEVVGRRAWHQGGQQGGKAGSSCAA